MSEDAPTGLILAEKLMGIIILIMGVLLSYYTYENIEAAGVSAVVFIIAGIALIILGIIMLIAKTS
ncbi:hypothetical protein DRO55_03515 [Candidatus Bathyarchaeota archaeon]|nr:MAG: hypothetical protein DRO55_03515 [Candidatus Bathyarchaeota archaeon]